MKKTVIAVLILAACGVYAEDPSDMEKIEAQRLEWTKKHFAAEGLPVPDGGITVMPESKISTDKASRERRLQERTEIKQYGFINSRSSEYKALIEVKNISPQQLKLNALNSTPYDENMHRNLSEIHMAYEFTEVPIKEIKKVIGFTPAVTYISEKGWVGAAEFFELDDVTVCNYSENNIKLSHGSIIIPKEEARKDINGKFTTIDIEGQIKSGFVYDIRWYDENFFSQLECASAQYDTENTKKLVELAKKIDKAKKI